MLDPLNTGRLFKWDGGSIVWIEKCKIRSGYLLVEALFSLILVAGTAMTYLSIHTIMQQTEIQNVSKVNRTRRVYEQKIREKK
ncbi:hypothetical protein LOSG293_170130 [Secundilactobacillus oryzae JCM 18671]|uniref:Uncharacterized protein n=1 Tax=Secundilactobacillus oryzae JCM 18671 TaxID=1291743 RepID=A0A081BIZ3_9LACO|nr:hypothetical protein LOSG293_170130 [Secundilactobacillus oryzae JCM 18671]